MTTPLGISKWAHCKLEDVCELVNGRAYKRPEFLDEGKYRVLRVGNLFTNNTWFWSDLELDEHKYIDDGDLIYAWSASFGPRIWRGEKVIYHYHIWKCLPDPALIDKHFLYRLFEWDVAKIKADHGTGSTMIHVTKGDMEARPIDLPPLPEQRRIVAKLDRLSARSAAARDHLAHTTKLATRAKQAVLAEVFREASGTAEEYIESTFYGPRFAKTAYITGGVPTLRTTDFRADGVIQLGDAPTVEVSEKEFAKWGLLDGDLLVTRTGSIGKCAVYEEEMGPALPSAYLIRVRLDLSKADPWFVYYAFASPEGQRFLGASATAITQPNVNATAIRSVPVPFVELPVQQEIVRRIEAAFARIDRMTEEASRAAHLLDRLDERLLAKAFRGELVPQDPEDEPAEALLTRIRQSRAAAPKAKRGRKKAQA